MLVLRYIVKYSRTFILRSRLLTVTSCLRYHPEMGFITFLSRINTVVVLLFWRWGWATVLKCRQFCVTVYKILVWFKFSRYKVSALQTIRDHLETITPTRMHSSRMRTARLLTVSRSSQGGGEVGASAQSHWMQTPPGADSPGHVTCHACWEANPPPLAQNDWQTLPKT